MNFITDLKMKKISRDAITTITTTITTTTIITPLIPLELVRTKMEKELEIYTVDLPNHNDNFKVTTI